MSLALGIDTGGTYTDAVVLEYESSTILAQAKALTTRADLAIGIREAMNRVLACPGVEREDVRLVSVSTTLATNAIVEGSGAPICALLIGYGAQFAPSNNGAHGDSLARELGTTRYALIPGGHTTTGEEQTPLDLAAARAAILEHAPHVAGFAVSGYFGTRSPEHELAVKRLVQDLTGLPVTCGHELTQRLDAVRRAATVCLNARLIPLLCSLVAAVRATMAEEGIDAPLMVVKGDGSLMTAEVAMERPVETILSGPAASVVGARHLAGGQDVVVADMGGTTTDIAVLREGRPRLNPQGAQVGRWRTMVEAIDVHTVGLGGDSRAWLDDVYDLHVGPRRVAPISWLATRHPEVIAELRERLAGVRARTERALQAGEFLTLQRAYAVGRPGDPPFAEALLAALERGPVSLYGAYALMRYPSLYMGYLERLEREGAVLRAGLTPTDAAHVLGHYTEWSVEAATLAAEILAEPLGVSAETVCERVIAQTSKRIALELVRKTGSDDGLNGGSHAEEFIERALAPLQGGALSCSVTLQPDLVAVGAPVAVYFPWVADALHTRLHVPAHSDVANAVGAVVGSVVARVHALVAPRPESDTLRVHLPGESAEYDTLSEALAYAERRGQELALQEALRAGAADVQVEVGRHDSTAPVAGGWGQDIYVQTEFVCTAVGRPRLAPR